MRVLISLLVIALIIGSALTDDLECSFGTDCVSCTQRGCSWSSSTSECLPSSSYTENWDYNSITECPGFCDHSALSIAAGCSPYNSDPVFDCGNFTGCAECLVSDAIFDEMTYQRSRTPSCIYDTKNAICVASYPNFDTSRYTSDYAQCSISANSCAECNNLGLRLQTTAQTQLARVRGLLDEFSPFYYFSSIYYGNTGCLILFDTSYSPSEDCWAGYSPKVQTARQSFTLPVTRDWFGVFLQLTTTAASIAFIAIALIGLALLRPLPNAFPNLIADKVQFVLAKLDLRPDLVFYAPPTGTPLRKDKSPLGGFVSVVLFLVLVVAAIYLAVSFNAISNVVTSDATVSSVQSRLIPTVSVHILMQNVNCSSVVSLNNDNPFVLCQYGTPALPACMMTMKSSPFQLREELTFGVSLKQAGQQLPNLVYYYVSSATDVEDESHHAWPPVCAPTLPQTLELFPLLDTVNQYLFAESMVMCANSSCGFIQNTSATVEFRIPASVRVRCNQSQQSLAQCPVSGLLLASGNTQQLQYPSANGVSQLRISIPVAETAIVTTVFANSWFSYAGRVFGLFGSVLAIHPVARTVLEIISQYDYFRQPVAAVVVPFLPVLSYFSGNSETVYLQSVGSAFVILPITVASLYFTQAVGAASGYSFIVFITWSMIIYWPLLALLMLVRGDTKQSSERGTIWSGIGGFMVGCFVPFWGSLFSMRRNWSIVFRLSSLVALSFYVMTIFGFSSSGIFEAWKMAPFMIYWFAIAVICTFGTYSAVLLMIYQHWAGVVRPKSDSPARSTLVGSLVGAAVPGLGIFFLLIPRRVSPTLLMAALNAQTIFTVVSLVFGGYDSLILIGQTTFLLIQFTSVFGALCLRFTLIRSEAAETEEASPPVWHYFVGIAAALIPILGMTFTSNVVSRRFNAGMSFGMVLLAFMSPFMASIGFWLPSSRPVQPSILPWGVATVILYTTACGIILVLALIVSSQSVATEFTDLELLDETTAVGGDENGTSEEEALAKGLSIQGGQSGTSNSDEEEKESAGEHHRLL